MDDDDFYQDDDLFDDDEIEEEEPLDAPTEPAEKKKRKKKDPMKPKGAQSSYIIFSNEERPNVKAEMGEAATFGDCARELAKRWKALTESEKAPYVARSAQDKQRHALEMQGYEAPPDDDGGKKRAKKAKKVKDPNAPKKPLTAYFVFQSAKRAELKAVNPDMKMGEMSKLIGAAWKALSEDGQRPFIEKAAELKIQYAIDKAAYDGGGIGGGVGGGADAADAYGAVGYDDEYSY